MKYLYIIIWFFTLPLFSQEKLEFTYKVTSVGTMYDPLDENSQSIKMYIEKMEAQLDDLTYTLRIKGNDSYWFLQDANSYPNSHMGKAMAGGYSYFFDGKNYIEQKDFLDNYFIVQKEQKNFNWELLNETKQILGYTCKKAIARETKLIKGENKVFETIAWYCPDLKYSIGPQDFGGLDGLILELIDKKRKYYCSEIVPYEKIPLFILTKPSKGKLVTEAEFFIEMKKIQEEKGIPSVKD